MFEKEQLYFDSTLVTRRIACHYFCPFSFSVNLIELRTTVLKYAMTASSSRPAETIPCTNAHIGY
jgi:hypothetical protein